MVNISEIIAPVYHDMTKDILNHGHTDYTIFGGRGTTKSSDVSITVPLLIMLHSDAHAVVFRKLSNTLRDSVFNQYLWGIEQLGVSQYWQAKYSPCELIYKPTGQRIMFRGLDDPMKIKSIKLPFGYIAITHFEELDQYQSRKEIRTTLQSTRRGGEIFWNFETFNPPISRENWANKDILIEYPDRYIQTATYLDIPRHWLGEQFFKDAERLKQIDEKAYQHEYLGIPVGTGGNVFDKIELRNITDEEIASFDHIYMGADWGFDPDPFAFVRLHYDRHRETIYMIDELYVNRWGNAKTAEWIRNKGYTDGYIICDSAEPKSVADFRACGLPARPAKKGARSIEYGMKWLQGKTIVIDKRRTPNIQEEFLHYEYERNKDGEFVSGYPDKKNHSIDATRYAVEPVSGLYGFNA